MAELTKDQMAKYEKEKEDLFINLNRKAMGHVEDLERALLALEPVTARGEPATAVQGAMPAQRAIQGSLPWFKHGLRGFLRKLWYGDHPSNPDWQHVVGVTSESIGKTLTLQEYVAIETTIDNALDEFFAEASAANNLSSTIQSYFQQFKKNLQTTILYYTHQMYDLGKKHGQEVGGTETATEAPSPPPPPAPTEIKKDDDIVGAGEIDRSAPPAHTETPPPPAHVEEPSAAIHVDEPPAHVEEPAAAAHAEEPPVRHEPPAPTPSDNPFEDAPAAAHADETPAGEDDQLAIDEPHPEEGEEARVTHMRDIPANHRGEDEILGVQAANGFAPVALKHASEEEPVKAPGKKGRPRGHGGVKQETSIPEQFRKLLRKSGERDLKLKKQMSPNDLEAALVHLQRSGVDLYNPHKVVQALYDATHKKYADGGDLIEKYAKLTGMSQHDAHEFIVSKASQQQESRKWTMSKVRQMLHEQSLSQGSELLQVPLKIRY